LVKNVVKHKNKIVTSDVDITVVLVVKVKIKKSSVKIFQERWQVKMFCIFDHCYFISSPTKLKICDTIKQGCATGDPRATTRPAKPLSVALANTLIFPHHA